LAAALTLLTYVNIFGRMLATAWRLTPTAKPIWPADRDHWRKRVTGVCRWLVLAISPAPDI